VVVRPAMTEPTSAQDLYQPVGDSWRPNETYIKVRGQWVYLYRAVDKEGCIVDFLLSRLTGKAITAPENVGRGLGGLKSGKSFARQKHTLNKICTRTLEIWGVRSDSGVTSIESPNRVLDFASPLRPGLEHKTCSDGMLLPTGLVRL
jgi:DDE domain